MPRVGHLYAVYYMFAFLKVNHNGVMVFDPTLTLINLSFPLKIGLHQPTVNAKKRSLLMLLELVVSVLL